MRGTGGEALAGDRIASGQTTSGGDPGGATPAEVEGARGAGIARNASYLALGQAGTTALAILFSAALGRALGAGDFGLYFLATSTSTFACVFVEWGQAPVVIRETARDPHRAGELLGTALALRALAAVAISVLLVPIAWLFGYTAQLRWLFLAYFAASLPFFLSQGFAMVFRGRDRMDREAAVSVLNRAVGLLLVLVALARGGGLVSIALAQCAAGLVALGAARRFYRKLGAPRLAFSSETARSLLVAGTPIVAMVATSAAQPYLDVVILSRLAPADAVGWYAVAKNILGTLVAPALILGGASFPQLSRAATDPSRFQASVCAALRPMLFLGALGSAGTYLFATTAVHVIYGKSGFAPAATILEVSSPTLVLLFVDTLLGYALVATGRAKGFAMAKVASVVLSTALDIVLIPWFQLHHGNGSVGAVAAFGLSEIAVFAWAVVIMPRGALGPRFASQAAKALLAAGSTVLLLRVLPDLPPFVGIPLTVAAFGGMALAVGLLHRSDLALVRALARRWVSPQPSSGA